MVFVTVSAGYTAAAALAGAATVLEMTKAGRSAMEILGWCKPERSMLSAAEKTFNCHLWIGFTWRPCVLGMAGDLLVLSGRFVEEARLMESAHVSVQDFYASVALLVGDPLQLCFHSAEEAQSFAMEVTKRACLKKDMMKLADQAKDLRESLSSATLSSDRSKQNLSSRSSRRPSKTVEKKKEAQAQALRTRLAVPKGVPMYTLSPCASGDLHLDEITRLPVPSFKAPALAPPPVAPLAIPRESSESSLQAMPKNPQIPTLKINRANSCPSPSKLQLSGDSSTASLSSDFAELGRRGSTGSLGGDGDGDGGRFGAERTSLRRHSETPQMLITSPRDPESFASKVFMGLGLDSAKASLVAQKRVDVLKTKFEAAKGNSSCSSSPTPSV